MNRQIWGIALFLVIVKTSFLLYWGFFAPNNFYRTETDTQFNVDNVEVKRTCKLSAKSVKPELQNVVINTKTGKLTESTQFQTTKGEWAKMRLHLFSEDGSLVWTGDKLVENYVAGTLDFQQSTFAMNFETSSTKLIGLNPNKNYYAQLEVSPETSLANDHCAFDIENATPVLLNYGK